MYKIKLSPYHKIFYNEWKLAPSSNKYNIVFDQTISNTLDLYRLKTALNKFIAEHLLLNSHVIEIDDEPYWVKNHDISQLEFFNNVYTNTQIFTYVSHPFNLNTEPLYRFAVFKDANDNYRFVAVLHHLIIDGNYFDTFISNISNYYNSTEYSSKISLSEQLKLNIATTEALEKQSGISNAKYSNFWQSKLSDSEPLDLRFIIIHTSKSIDPATNSIKELCFNFNEAHQTQLAHITHKYGITQYTYSQCVFAILLYKYTSQNKFAISYPVSIKDGTDYIYGAKINTNIIPFSFSTNTTVPQLFKASNDFIKSLKSSKFNFSHFPIDKIIGVTNTELLNVTFAQTNLKNTEFNFLKAKTLLVNKALNIDLFGKLCFEQEIKEKKLNFRVRYNIQETDETILQNFTKHYQKLFIDILEDLINSSNGKLIAEYQMLSNEEYQQIVYHRNNTRSPYPDKKTIHQIFEEQVARTPDNIAVVHEDKKLTYKDLNEKSNQLANYLRKTYKIKGDDLIALFLNRSEYIIIAILGVLKAGGAYVPLATGYPDKRIAHILKNMATRLIITTASYAKQFVSHYKKNSTFSILSIDEHELQNKLTKLPLANLSTITTSNNLAYVMYTSGTTGVPNGVMVEHKNVVSLAYKTNYINITANDCIMELSDISFDASTFEIWGALLHGARLYIPENVVELLSDLIYFKQLLSKYNVSILWLTKTLFDELYIQDNALFKKLTYLLIGGEALNYNLINKIANSEYCPKYLINGYGPTENTTFSCTFRINMHGILNLGTVPIGKPIANKSAYILNDNLIPVPLGCIGELYLGGDGLARGYLNQSQLTSQKFLNNPFQIESEKRLNTNTRIYKTGDLVRMLPDGNIEYIGRNDSQIKINGYRIELSEIESKLVQYPQIRQALVLVDSKSKNIVAYYIAKHKLDESVINNYLKTELPKYMLPQALIYLKKLPVTINGKLDKQSLPTTKVTDLNTYVPPRNPLEAQICRIFAETLNYPTEKVSINDDFFNLGGNSISVIRLIAKLQRNFNVCVNDVFKLRTPAKIASVTQYTKNNLLNKLELIKNIYAKIQYNIENTEVPATIKFNFTKTVKSISTVLLTGSTGHLGCHILYQLLQETKYRIYLLVRQTDNVTKNGYNRICDKFKYYFDINLEDFHDRLIVWESDLTEINLGLNEVQYQELVTNLDSIIHCAALVKHYGDYMDFYKVNVQSTINLLDLCKLTQYKDFHYISTIGVFTDSQSSEIMLPVKRHKEYGSRRVFTEDSVTDIRIDKRKFYTYYTQTKYEGELITLKYKKYGIKSSIYRVGNLSMNSKNYKNQANIEENAFFQRVKTILNFGVVPKELSEVEISPVDCVAEAIIKLFQQDKLINQTYHVFNPNICNLYKLFAKCKNVNVILTSFDNFIDIIQKHLNNDSDARQLELFMLHQGWLNEEIGINNLARMTVLQNKTSAVLTQLNFSWPKINHEMLSDVISQSFIRINKMMEREQILKHLDFIAQMAPAAFYLLDIDGRFISVNEGTLKATGAARKENIINKTVYELYKNKEVADALQKDIDEVIKTGKTSTREDKIIDVSTGQYKYFTAIKAPLRDYSGEIFGIIGTSVEITAEKEAERLKHENIKLEAKQLKHENVKLEAQNKLNKIILEKSALEADTERLRLENKVQKLENEKHKLAAEEQERFRSFVGQIVHDIQSPLSSLRGLVNESSHAIPEKERITLRQASMRISDIAQHMLSRYKNKVDENEMAEPVLVSATMLEILGEKRYEHKEVEFITDFMPSADFAFIHIEPNQFKRMMSNLLNNAVEALENKPDGTIDLSLNVDEEWVMIIVYDNGKGMSKELIDKINKNISVTEGKKHGSGIGMTQIKDTIKRNFGEFEITSVPGQMTSILLKFPKIPAPFWIAEEIKISKDDTIVILDDDPSIHSAWDSKLVPTLTKIPGLKVKHFSVGTEAVSFINSLPDPEKTNICLLTDYELLGQDINGLLVIEQTKIKRSTLVTSHYANKEIRKKAANLRIKILPKELAFAVTINLDKKITPGSKKVDIVWVDDARWFIRDWKLKFPDLTIDAYYDPDSFLEDVAQYPLNTKIILDRTYYDGEGPDRNFLGDGIDLAKTLHQRGYTRLFMITGDEPVSDKVLDYLTVIFKKDDEKIREIAKL